MICQSCGKNNATTYVKTIVGGVLSEYALCSECAKQLGYSNFLSDFEFHFGNLISQNRDSAKSKSAPISRRSARRSFFSLR